MTAALDAIRAHDLVPYPDRGRFAEVRMVYCRRCGASQTVEAAGEHAPLPPCLAALDRAEAVVRAAKVGLKVLHAPHFGWGCNSANCSGQAALDAIAALEAS